MAQTVFQHIFPNGLTLLAERMEHVRSAAMYFLVPAGCVFDPAGQPGLASILAEMITRGAGKRDSRALALALDNLGLDRVERVSSMHMQFWGATVAQNLPAALDIYGDILRRPHLNDEELDPARALALQELKGLEDDPQRKVMVELHRRHFPPPLGNDRRGTVQSLESMNANMVRHYYRQQFQPQGTILSVAGNIDWKPLKDQVERLFGDWPGGNLPSLRIGKAPGGRGHLAKDTTQTQIAIAYPSVPFGHPDYYAAKGAVQVLSGGMSARLFTEVREKRGLCYSVGASYSTFKDRASILCYAGTTNKRAQETLNVTLEEIVRLKEGITKDEIDRLQAGLKSSLIMQEESTSARAGAIASDWYYLGRVRTLEEIQSAINGLTPKKIVAHLHRYPPRDFTIVTLGPKALRLPKKFQDQPKGLAV